MIFESFHNWKRLFQPFLGLDFFNNYTHTAWNLSRYGVFSSPNRGKYGSEKTPYLDTFHAVSWLVEDLFDSTFLEIFSSVYPMKMKHCTIDTQLIHCKKWSLPLRISSVNVTKSAASCPFGHIWWRNP